MFLSVLRRPQTNTSPSRVLRLSLHLNTLWLIEHNSELGSSGLGTETLHFVVTPMVPTVEGDSLETHCENH